MITTKHYCKAQTAYIYIYIYIYIGHLLYTIKTNFYLIKWAINERRNWYLLSTILPLKPSLTLVDKDLNVENVLRGCWLRRSITTWFRVRFLSYHLIYIMPITVFSHCIQDDFQNIFTTVEIRTHRSTYWFCYLLAKTTFLTLLKVGIADVKIAWNENENPSKLNYCIQ